MLSSLLALYTKPHIVVPLSILESLRRVRYHSLCRVATCGSAHQYKIQAVTFPDSSGYAIHKHSQAQNIIFQVYTHISGSKRWKSISATRQKREILAVLHHQRVLYVGLAHTAPPTNANFRLTFLLPRLQEALYEDLAV